MCRDAVGKQIPRFKQQWSGRMHRVDMFLYRVKPPPDAEVNTPARTSGAPPTAAA